MKRLFIFIFLFLYFHNLVGYLAVYTVMKYRIQGEVKEMIKASVPISELASFSFLTADLDREAAAIQWMADDEFRYEGRMYDIVSVHVNGDSTHFNCINDVQEERLFADLGDHVRRQMGDSGNQGRLDAFKDVFKDSHFHIIRWCNRLPATGTMATLSVQEYASICLDVPFLPPRFSPATAHHLSLT